MKNISLANNHNNILIRFSFQGKRFCFAPVKGGLFSNQKHRRIAEKIAIQISLDIANGDFDESLVKYGVEEKPEISLKELWENYTEFKTATGLAKSTLKNDFGNVNKVLQNIPNLELAESIKIRDWLIKNKTLDQVKRIMMQLNACCNWAVESRLIKTNPFDKIRKQVKIKKSEIDINPFTQSERDEIIEAFKASKYYSYYSNLVEFIFYTGCRPCEAIPLEKSDIQAGKIIFNKSYVYGNIENRLKTQKKRIIRINEQLQAVIDNLPVSSSKLVFPSPKTGGYINWSNFTRKAWLKTLEQLQHIKYRNPYQMRHTFVTLALQAGVPITDIAKHCGNSPKIILDYYAGTTRDFVMPPL